MNHKHFGDAPDFVKQSLLRGLSVGHKWWVHPMFTDDKPEHYASIYCDFLGAQPITIKTFEQFERSGRNRKDWVVEVSAACKGHLFVDPDTGFVDPLTGFLLRNGTLPSNRDHRKYLLHCELVKIVQDRPIQLTLVYDQSISRSTATTQIRRKLKWLKEQCIHGLTYFGGTNMSFILVSDNQKVLSAAKDALLDSSKLPKDRLIEV